MKITVTHACAGGTTPNHDATTVVGKWGSDEEYLWDRRTRIRTLIDQLDMQISKEKNVRDFCRLIRASAILWREERFLSAHLAEIGRADMHPLPGSSRKVEPLL